MKTLIVILAAALASPAFGHTDVSKSNTSSSSSTTSSSAPVYEDSSSMSGSSSASAPIEEEESSSLSGSSMSEEEDYATSTNDDSNLSGSSSTTDSEEVDSSSSLSGASTSSSDVSTSSETSTVAPSATSPSYSGSASGTTAAPGATATAPAATVAPPAPATAETTSRTYSEMDAEERNVGGLYLEPAIFGSQQDADIEGAAIGADQTGEVNGFGGDLKFGGHVNEMFFLAANARYERSQFEESSLGDTDADTYNWGPTLGVQAPWMGARVWGSYIIDGSADPEAAANGVNLKFDDPYGWRVGAGIRLAAVSLNLEYQDLTYRTTEIQSAGNVAGATDAPIDFAQRGYSVSLSFPFQL